MKQIIFILIFIFFWTLSSYSQNKISTDYSNNFYKKAFGTYLDSLESYFAPITELDPDWYKLKIKKNVAITFFLRDKFEKYEIEIFDNDSIISILNGSNKTIVLTEITPIHINNDKLTINFIDLEMSLKENTLREEIVSGCTLEYIFNCDSNKFIIEKSDFWFAIE
ncbi:hypothetical protein [Marinifilum fragile]|uniref:hypothetical protein n=1 Tax=Marinifilum fragile TaxID=570161 RepID=UPI002AA7BE4E|nr:hypothetical protein [Marinifilum fragile]